MVGNRGCVLLRKPRSWEQRAGMTPCSSAASAQHVCYAKKVALCLQTIKKTKQISANQTHRAGWVLAELLGKSHEHPELLQVM